MRKHRIIAILIFISLIALISIGNVVAYFILRGIPSREEQGVMLPGEEKFLAERTITFKSNFDDFDNGTKQVSITIYNGDTLNNNLASIPQIPDLVDLEPYLSVSSNWFTKDEVQGKYEIFNMNQIITSDITLYTYLDTFPDFSSAKYRYSFIQQSGTINFYDLEIKGFVNPGDNIADQMPDSLDIFNVTTIGQQAFFGCTQLQSVHMGNEIKYILFEAFAQTTMETLTNTSQVLEVHNNAFSMNHSLGGVIDFSNAIMIGEQAFNFTWGLEEVVLPTTPEYTVIQPHTFYGSGLLRVNIPDNVVEIGAGAYFSVNPYGLTTVPLDLNLGNVKVIGSLAFSEATIINIEIPATVLRIHSHAFRDSYIQNLTFEEIGDPSAVDDNDRNLGIFEFAFYDNPFASDIVLTSRIYGINEQAFFTMISPVLILIDARALTVVVKNWIITNDIDIGPNIPIIWN